MTIQSGVPQTLTIGFNNAGTNNPLPDRPSYSGIGNGYLSNHTHTSHGVPWYDPASFVLAPAGNLRQCRTKFNDYARISDVRSGGA